MRSDNDNTQGGDLEAVILSSLRRGAGHGFEIQRRLETAECGAIKLTEGSLYPVLYKLEAARLIKGRWQEPSKNRRGSRRRVYSLTRKGLRELKRSDSARHRSAIQQRHALHEDKKQLMLQVEQIVADVRAFQLRKLRMRQELLIHLQSAFYEERARGLDEHTALEQAVKRMGDPEVLARQLQQTVPWIQRLLTTRLSLIAANQWEDPLSRHLYEAAITLMHTIVLFGIAAVLIAIPFFIAAPTTASSSGSTAITAPHFSIGLFVLRAVIVAVSCRYVLSAADLRSRPDLLAMLRRAGTVVGLQVAIIVLMTMMAMDRAPSAIEIIGNIAATLLLLIGSVLIARRYASLRRPYAEWLTLAHVG